MATETDIANRALQRLGSSVMESTTRTSPWTGSKRDLACEAAYDVVRDEVLRASTWACTSTRAELKAFPIYAVTTANPSVVMVPGHSFVVNDEVIITDVVGMVDLNVISAIEAWTVSAVTSGTITLANSHYAQIFDTGVATTIGSYHLTALTDTSLNKVGEAIAGDGMPTGTTIEVITSATTLQVSNVGTITDTGVTFASGGMTAYTSGGEVKLKPPAFGYDQRRRLPTDCLRVLEVYDSDLPWVVEGDDILSDEAATIDIRYTRSGVDTADYDALLVSAMSARLAVEMCELITQSNTKKEALMQAYQLHLDQARAIDAAEQSPQDFEEEDWLLARF